MKLLAFDIGGTYIKYAILDKDKNFSREGRVRTPLDSFDHFIEVISPIIEESRSSISGLAFSLPGTIDVEKGIIIQGGTLRYHTGLNFVEKMERLTGLPVSIENDARCAALAELHFGNLQNIQNGIVVIMGTGIGGAIVHNRELYKGTNLYAGEFSILMTRSIKELQKENLSGEILGIPNFAKRVSTVLQKNVDGEAVFQLIQEGNEEVSALFHDYIASMIPFLFNLQMLYDPERILIGGGVSRNDLYIQTIKEGLNQLYAKWPTPIPKIQLEACKFKNKSNLLGAYIQFMTSKNSK
ncbi:ROK family protein [Enterococcus faecalis]|nr:ROK family protein [Enterococcus faecalis]